VSAFSVQAAGERTRRTEGARAELPAGRYTLGTVLFGSGGVIAPELSVEVRAGAETVVRCDEGYGLCVVR
jgi:hypothetical protein